MAQPSSPPTINYCFILSRSQDQCESADGCVWVVYPNGRGLCESPENLECPNLDKDACKITPNCEYDNKSKLCTKDTLAPTPAPVTSPPSDLPTNGPSIMRSTSPSVSLSDVPVSCFCCLIVKKVPHRLFPCAQSIPPSINRSDMPSSSPSISPSHISSSSPSSLPSYHPTIYPTTSPTVSASPTVTISSQPSSHPSKSSAPTSMEPTEAPISLEPTEAPISIEPTGSPTKSVAPTVAPYKYIRPGRVDIRYVTWDRLTDDQRLIASGDLEYNRETWNELGTNPLENLRWSDLNARQQSSASLLGYDEPSWDCWLHHYESFSLGEVKELELGVYFSELGLANLVSRREDWDDLTAEQQQAAGQLCFFKSNYDRLDVSIFDYACMQALLH